MIDENILIHLSICRKTGSRRWNACHSLWRKLFIFVVC